MAIVDEQDYTKISIRKDLHSIVKDICAKEGIKMYHFEDEAIKLYIKTNYPKYAENRYNKLIIDGEEE